MIARAEIAITGVGAVSAHGWGVEPLWRGLSEGPAAIRPFDLFDHSRHRTHLAAQVPSPFPPLTIDRHASRSDRFAITAAAEALRSADLDLAATDTARSVGAFFGSSTGGMFEAESFFRILVERGGDRLPMRRLATHQNNSPGDAVARRFGVTGPVETVSTACAAGSMAIGNACRALDSGEVDVAITGGADGLCQLTYAGFNALRAVDVEPCRPFRADRRGLSLGEGAGVLVLETAEHARRRGARILGWLCGAAASCDAFHMTAPVRDGSGAARAMLGALQRARCAPEAIAFVNAHGTGTAHNDVAEWHALRQVFGDRASAVPVTSTKGSIGHLLGAAGAIEAVATVLCLVHGAVHPTPGDGAIAEGVEIDLVRGAPRAIVHPGIAISVNLAFGGANAAIVVAGEST
ncbi:MAG: beta-ketoacyl-[acyl-carrier-protein] synthase family protein [Planctomycetes bacterium]|nr:beta-ketoacyl-[acyl-carrier-protein] synthase family protein [Planctomycetota bacterium]